MKSEYKPAKFNFTEQQIHKIKHGHGVRVSHHQIGHGPHVLFLHPHQHHRLSLNHSKGKGMDLMITDGELAHTINSGVQGTGIWDSIKSGFNKYVKPVLSTIGDIGANALSYTNPELAPVIQGVRGGVKNLTGVGLKHHPHHNKHHAHESREDMHEGKHMLHHEMKHMGRHKKKRITKHGNGLYL